jgi:hypothetical protein
MLHQEDQVVVGDVSLNTSTCYLSVDSHPALVVTSHVWGALVVRASNPSYTPRSLLALDP